MGSELGPWAEWNHDSALPWELLQQPLHRGLSDLVADLNRIYRSSPALYQLDERAEGFQWIDHRDAASSVVSFLRRGKQLDDVLIVVCNFTPVVRSNYRIGVPLACDYAEILNTDAGSLGGSDVGNLGQLSASNEPRHGFPHSLTLTLPPLSTIYLQPLPKASP
jgi:1,4-alpha-glucan branching enzyme